MNESVEYGFLLKMVHLPTGDTLADFVTQNHGRVTVKIRSFQSSVKRKAQIDFFRVLELGLAKKGEYYTLKKAETVNVFHQFQDNYSLNQQGFFWLEELQKTLYPHKPLEGFFTFLLHLLATATPENQKLLEVVFRIHLLEYVGAMRRFDIHRGDVYIDPQTFDFYTKKAKDGLLLIENETRQLFEFLRRSTVEEVDTKADSLPLEKITFIEQILDKLEPYHIHR